MEHDPALDILKKRYFDLAGQENYPNTPKISSELDAIEEAITKLTGKKLEKCTDRATAP